MKKRFRQFVILGLIIGVVLTVAGLVYRTYGHRELEKYLGELRGNGEKLTLRELSTTLSTNFNDSASAVSNAVARLGPAPRDLDGLVTSVLLPYSRSEQGRVRVAWKLEIPAMTDTPQGGAIFTWSDLSNSVAAINAPLEELRQALKQPSPNTGPAANRTMSASPDALENSASWLAAATLMELHFGRRAEAIADLQAFLGLAALNREDYDPTNQMTRIGLIDAAMELTWQALQSPDWTPDQLLELQRRWQTLDALDALKRCLVGQRADCLEMLSAIAEHQPRSYAKASRSQYASITMERLNQLLIETVMDQDLLFRLRQTQAQVEIVNSLQTNRAWKDADLGLRKLDVDLAKVSHLPQRWLFSLSVSSIPDMKPVFQQAVRAETERRLTLVAIGLKRYRLKYGRLPPNLESFGGDYLPVVPRDCMSTRSLNYQARGDGTFLLYSVGTDGKDNGGDPTPAVASAKPGLWEGRDAVWPWPAK